MQLKGTLKGHNGWVTQIATNARFPNMIISSSRGRNGFCWMAIMIHSAAKSIFGSFERIMSVVCFGRKVVDTINF